jgi:integrase
VHPKVAQERLGHSTITTTLDLYSHVTENMQQARRGSWTKPSVLS